MEKAISQPKPHLKFTWTDFGNFKYRGPLENWKLKPLLSF